MKVKKKATKLKCVLLDADIIIKLFEQGIWKNMLDVLEIKVPSIVVEEAFFFKDEQGIIHYSIDLKRLESEGKIEVFPASIIDIENLKNQFDDSFSLDSGEEEAIALLFAGKAKDAKFCTADKAAIQALAMLRLSEQGISLEKLLKLNGISQNLIYECTDAHFKKHIEKGNLRFILGQGLVKKKS